MLDNERTLKSSSNAQHKKEKTFSYDLPEMLNLFTVSIFKEKSTGYWAIIWQDKQNECVLSEYSDQTGPESLLCAYWATKDCSFLHEVSKASDKMRGHWKTTLMLNTRKR